MSGSGLRIKLKRGIASVQDSRVMAQRVVSQNGLFLKQKSDNEKLLGKILAPPGGPVDDSAERSPSTHMAQSKSQIQSSFYNRKAPGNNYMNPYSNHRSGAFSQSSSQCKMKLSKNTLLMQNKSTRPYALIANNFPRAPQEKHESGRT